MELRDGDVHLWRGSVDISSPRATELARLLSPSERNRAARFHSTRHSVWSIGRHAWLRLLLSRYLAEDPASLEIEVEEHGKPRLTGVSQRWLRFNISDSGSVVVGVVARDREVGIDVERIRSDVDIEGVSRRSMSTVQRRELLALPSDARVASFFAMWTRNEAYLKGIGTGLGGGQHHDVDSTPGWSVSVFDMGTQYAAAVAVAGNRPNIAEAVRELSLQPQRH